MHATVSLRLRWRPRPLVSLTGIVVGFVWSGLTGMGGGALMTPLLVLLFKIEPLAAVSSDLVAAFVMKPVGASVHLRRGTVHLELVKWLVIGVGPRVRSVRRPDPQPAR